MKYAKQCKFKNGDTHRVSWIDEKGASVGAKMKFKDEDDGILWEVVEVWDSRKPLEEVHERSRDYKRTRKESDIARDGRRQKLIHNFV